MFKTIKSIKVNYKQYGNGPDMVLLHGWGQNIEMMMPLGDNFSDKYRVTIIDLPGFGLSEEPKEDYDVVDYAEIVYELLQKLGIKKPIMMGHSFGGRVSIVYAAKYGVKKLVLFGSPCVRHERKSRKQDFYKAMKKIKILNPFVGFMKKHTGSIDYRSATPMMREILVKTVNQDLSDYAKEITSPTLLVWGENDEAVPVSEARELEKLLKDGALIVLPGTHYCYLENLNGVVNIINNFI